jgi:hypothetical protein
MWKGSISDQSWRSVSAVFVTVMKATDDLVNPDQDNDLYYDELIVVDDLHRDVDWAVDRAVGRAVDGALHISSWSTAPDEDHPALQDFLCVVGGVR